MKHIFRWLALPPLGLLLAAAVLLLANEWAVASASRRIANLPYVAASAPDFDAKRHLLDIYQPTKKAAPRPVVLFIHGGNWNSGSKDNLLYKAIGRRLASQGFVGVVISYRLSPQAIVPQQTDDCARALAWTVAHIKDYGGDPARIVLMGHSAGGGLAALLATGSDTLLAKHGLPAHAAHAVLLDDPAGLDMLDYLKKAAVPRRPAVPDSLHTQPGGVAAIVGHLPRAGRRAALQHLHRWRNLPQHQQQQRAVSAAVSGAGRGPQVYHYPRQKARGDGDAAVFREQPAVCGAA